MVRCVILGFPEGYGVHMAVYEQNIMNSRAFEVLGHARMSGNDSSVLPGGSHLEGHTSVQVVWFLQILYITQEVG